MAESALRALDQAYLMGIGQGPAPARVPKTRGQTTADILGAASLPMSAVPIAGDITGLAADAAMYAAYPEERTMGNYAMSALGVLPLVPGVAAVRAARGASPLEGTLDMSQAARMQRAAEQGFNVDMPLYHGTTDDFESFDIGRAGKNDSGWYGKGVYLTPDPDTASAYTQYQEFANRTGAPGANVIPVYTRLKNPYYWPENRKAALTTEESQLIRDELMARGHDGVIVSNKYADPKYQSNYEIIVFDPSNIRSTNAAFDPAKRGSSNILAGAAGGAIGLSALRGLQSEEQERKPD